MKTEVGIGPDSWGVWFADDPRQPPWTLFLDQVVEAGYRWVERGVGGYLPTDPDRLRRELLSRRLGLTGVSIMAPLHDEASASERERELNEVCEIATALDASTLIIMDGMYTDLLSGVPIGPRDLTPDQWACLVETTVSLADLARERWGVQVAFHPHAETHVETLEHIERLLAETDPDLISLCFDIGHHAYMGEDPIEFIRAHADRISYLHLKNVDRLVQPRIASEGLTFTQAVSEDVFVDPTHAHSSVSFAALKDVLEQTNYEGFAVVEQDMLPGQPLDKYLPIATRTRDHIREVGIG